MFLKTMKWIRQNNGKLALHVDEGSGYKPYTSSALYQSLMNANVKLHHETGVGLAFEPGFSFAQKALKAGYVYEATEN